MSKSAPNSKSDWSPPVTSYADVVAVETPALVVPVPVPVPPNASSRTSSNFAVTLSKSNSSSRKVSVSKGSPSKVDDKDAELPEREGELLVAEVLPPVALLVVLLLRRLLLLVLSCALDFGLGNDDGDDVEREGDLDDDGNEDEDDEGDLAWQSCRPYIVAAIVITHKLCRFIVVSGVLYSIPVEYNQWHSHVVFVTVPE